MAFMSEQFTISQLAAEFGVTARAMRFYEDRGLLSPARRGQARIYSRRDRARLALIVRGKRVGFSLTEIGEMLDLYDLKDGQETQLKTALEKFRARLVALEEQRHDLEASIEQLRQTCALVEEMLQNKDEAKRRVLVGYAVQPSNAS
ncbi:MAG: MerR family DNA-binding transcriptional regulator [Alphaproteobacteria bacterium]|nr:MerR family DNA-binding transcriptional regulator [Alphaproteobacteria bacterium]